MSKPYAEKHVGAILKKGKIPEESDYIKFGTQRFAKILKTLSQLSRYRKMLGNEYVVCACKDRYRYRRNHVEFLDLSAHLPEVQLASGTARISWKCASCAPTKYGARKTFFCCRLLCRLLEDRNEDRISHCAIRNLKRSHFRKRLFWPVKKKTQKTKTRKR